MDLPPTTSRGTGRGRSRPVRGVNVSADNFTSRLNIMMNEVFEDSESEGTDDTDADPDFVLPNDDVLEDAINTQDSDEEVIVEEGARGEPIEHEISNDDDDDLGVSLNQQPNVADQLPEYLFSRLRKHEFGPPYWWTTTQPPINVRTPSTNIIQGGLPGLTRVSRALGNSPTKAEVWDLLFDKYMIELIVVYTNQKLETKRNSLGETTNKVNYRPTNSVEINAYIGLQVLSTILKTSREDMTSLFSKDVTGRPYFTATMSCKRFEILTSCLRFDDQNTREQRKSTDKAAAITELFCKFVTNSQKAYCLTECVTIDEMLVPFRGRCSFKVYMPKKPHKYGVKIQCLCDAKTSYLYNAYIYTGKDSDGVGLTQQELKLQKPTQTVVRLCKPIKNTNRNVTSDNYFTSIESVDILSQNGLTQVGTMRKDKLIIPNELLQNKRRVPGSSIHGFHNQFTLVSYVPQKNKAVVLMSSMHHSAAVDSVTKKPEIICFYNKTKCGVDIMDMKCATYASNRRTRRWPLAIFYRILNVCTVNSYIIFLSYRDSPMITRYEFIKELSKELIEPHLRQRLLIQNLPRDVKQVIKKALDEEPQPAAQQRNVPDDKLQKRKTCRKCPAYKERKAGHICIKCSEPICAECSRRVCTECAKECV